MTGGTGYIGSHTVVQLLGAGARVVVLDNLSNSHPKVLRRIEAITGHLPLFIKGDIRDRSFLKTLFEAHTIYAVIHFAGLKAVGESVEKPMLYYDNNVTGTLALIDAMAQAGVMRLVFSSSATVYGDPSTVPIHEGFPLKANSPYGRSKLMVEEILRDLGVSEPRWQIALLRYFNPVGAHASGLMGEDPSGIPNNLMPFVAQVAVGQREKLRVFGGDYPTPDGTGVRDYIHVEDLARGHLAALWAIKRKKGILTVNLGTGKGYSVLDVVRAFEQASGKVVPYEIADRRLGDVATCYADPARAREVLGWEASLDLNRMCEDAWHWQSRNPKGYRS